MNTVLHTQAIVLSSINYRDFDRIVTFLTEDYGLLKVIVYGGNRIKMRHLCEPYTHMKLSYAHKRNDIHTFKEAKVLDAHLNLRNSFEAMESAMQLLTITSKSQFLDSPCPKVFLLLKTYLSKIPLFKNPSILVSSYLIKTLLMSGHWTLQTKCGNCNISLSTFYYFNQDYFCNKCTPSKKLQFDIDEIKSLSELINERSFTALEKKPLSKNLSEKINEMWKLAHL